MSLKRDQLEILFSVYKSEICCVVICYCTCRAYPGSEFVVSNTLAKWEKLEPNEIDLSQKVVSRGCSVFNSLPASRPDLDLNCLTP